MKLKISNHPEVEYEMPESLDEFRDERERIKKEIAVYQAKIPKTQPTKAAQKLGQELQALKVRRIATKSIDRAMSRIQSELWAEVEAEEPKDYLKLLMLAKSAIRDRAKKMEDKAGFYLEHELETILCDIIDDLLRYSVYDRLLDNPPEELTQYLAVDETPKEPEIDITAIWEAVKGHSISQKVNIIRHRYTDYDRDRFRRHYLQAFTTANMWIADNFPQLADEAMAQIDDRFLREGKRRTG